jgi:acetyl esterase/lipase
VKKSIPKHPLPLVLLVFALVATVGYIAMNANVPALAEEQKASEAAAIVIILKIGSPTMTVNGDIKPIDENGTVPVIQDNRTLLPVRAVVEAMGGTVTWNAENQTATLACGGNTIRLIVGGNSAYLNDISQELDVAPVIINNRTMLPIRFIAESFGFSVVWDAAAAAVTISNVQGETGNPADLVPRTVEAVDLGLSVKWASFNVGAEKPEDYGTYFGWGDITGTNTSRDNNDYPNPNPPVNISGTEYDAARMLWGGAWKMPTREQAEELVNECDWKAEKLNNVDGFRVTGRNGNSIFLAAGGGRDGTSVNYTVVGADFWTGTLSETEGEAWCFTFYNGRVHADDLWRHYGFAVRPVMEQGGEHLTVNDAVSAIVNHHAFEGFGRYLMPWDDRSRDYDMPIAQAASTMPYHNYIQPQVVVDAVNCMIDEAGAGRTIFYDFYTDRDKAADPSKENAGLFFFRGDPGAPFAIISPGGGFSYVGSLHAGFPLAVEIAEAGYNAFVLKYRCGGQAQADADLATAIAYILANAKTLGVSADDYSLWGGSAGGMMVTDMVTRGLSSFGVGDLPKPAVQVLEYTTYANYRDNDRPLFSVVGDSDSLANVGIMQERVDAMRKAGLDVEFHVYPNLGHGFGRGDGTPAEGWIDLAVQFWAKHIGRADRR